MSSFPRSQHGAFNPWWAEPSRPTQIVLTLVARRCLISSSFLMHVLRLPISGIHVVTFVNSFQCFGAIMRPSFSRIFPAVSWSPNVRIEKSGKFHDFVDKTIMDVRRARLRKQNRQLAALKVLP